MIKGENGVLQYITTTHSLRSADLGKYRTCGILAVDEDKAVDALLDITPDASQAEHLAGLLNQYEVSLVHFRDVVEDYLAQCDQ